MSVSDKVYDAGKRFIGNKDVRNIFILLLTTFIILLINGLLPIIEGSTHYTASAITVSYAEYKQMRNENKHYQLTWSSEADVSEYINDYIADHPELNTEQKYTIEPPDTFRVDVYTKFFFQHAFWYVSTLVNIVSSVLLFYSFFNFILSKHKRRFTKYVDLVSQVDTLVDTSLDPVTFEPWMHDVFNKDRKISQHKTNIKVSLDKLDKRTDFHIRLECKKHPETLDPKCIEYLSKRNELLSYLEPEYIEDYISEINVKGFLYIHPSFVLSGYNGTGTISDGFSTIKSDQQRLGKDSIIKVTTSLLLTVMFAMVLTFTIVSSLDKPWYLMILNIVSQVAPLLIQIPLAYDYCESYMDTQLIPNLMARRTIALLYLAYVQENTRVPVVKEESVSSTHEDKNLDETKTDDVTTDTSVDTLCETSVEVGDSNGD